MKPAPFVHLAPDSLMDALEMLSEHTPDARVLAGGQSLVPLMNFRLSQPSCLIDINSISGLAYINDNGDHIAIGAMTRERCIENSDLVRNCIPLLYEATSYIGHAPIRNRGTIGGSIANADPAAEYPAVTLALDCQMILHSVRGVRRVSAAQFFNGIMSSVLEPDELLVEIIVPKRVGCFGSAFMEITRRHGDFALVGIAAQLTLSGKNVTDVQLAACGVGPTPIRLSLAEHEISEHGMTDIAVKSAARAAANEVNPTGDLHATADYRRRLTAVLTWRALLKAQERARKSA